MRNKNISMSAFGSRVDSSLYNTIKTSTDNYKREYNFEVNLDSYNHTPTKTAATFIKGDRNTSILKSTIIKGGEPLNLSEFTITVNVKEGSNSIITIPVTIISEEEGTIEINLPTNIVDEQGSNSFEISFQKDEDIIISQQYSYSVLDSLGEGDIGTPIQMTTLQTLITQVEASKDTVNFVTTNGQERIDEVIVNGQAGIEDVIVNGEISIGDVVTNGEVGINEVIVNGQNAMDNLVAELEVTSQDIEDIIGMVGGL